MVCSDGAFVPQLGTHVCCQPFTPTDLPLPVLNFGTPPPPCPRTTLRKNQPLVPRSNSHITFFTRVVGFSCFWWM